MALITVIDSSGGSLDATSQVQINVPSAGFTVELDGVSYEPALVQEIDMTNSGEMSSLTDQCGRTETRRAGDRNWEIMVSGIVTKNGSREDNLDLETLKNLSEGDTLRIFSDIHSGHVEVREVNVTQSNELVSINLGRGEEMAFEFQLQLREPEPQA